MNSNVLASASTPTNAVPVLRTLVCCEMVDAGVLTEGLGDIRAAELTRRLDRCLRDVMHKYSGLEIAKADGYLVMFERPIQAVGFSLAYQSALRDIATELDLVLHARIGIHVGDVMVWDNTAVDVAQGARPTELEGMVRSIVGRLAALALPGQILASAVACSLAQRSHPELGERATRTRWQAHGRYRFKGVHEPVGVHEVGEPGIAPFRVPPWSSKAHREVPWWRRPSTVVLEAALALGIIGGTAFLLLRPPQAVAFSERDWVVVGDLNNRTGDDVFDAALDTALRVGLEQSRYVNVVPQARVQQTLALMKQPNALLDRSVGSDVAQRERARALIVPSIVSYGKQLRVIAEVVDPQTGQTVLSDNVDMDSADQVMGAMDQLVQRLRAHLGESLAQIQASSMPLARVTTSNIEALKSYSLGVRAVYQEDFAQSFNLLHHATDLDPQFALAYGRIAANYLGLGQPMLAREPLTKALGLSDRLSSRERSYLDAHEASLRSPRDGISAWKVYADLYPDDGAGANNVGYYAFKDVNDCDQAVPYLKRASESLHPLHIASLYTMAYCELQLGQIDASLRDFEGARNGGFGKRWIGEADARLARGDYSGALRILDEPLRSGYSTNANPNARFLRKLTLLADQGDFRVALALADEISADAEHGEFWSIALARLSLLSIEDEQDEMRTQLRVLIPQLLALATQPDRSRDFDYRLYLAELSVWAARANLLDLAERAGAALERDSVVALHPARAQLATWAKAEVELRREQGRSALQRLAHVSDHPYWSLREAQARAAVAAQDSTTAQMVYRDLIERRGAALAELTTENAMGQTERIISWNLSRLALARLIAPTQPDQALTLLDAFTAQWPKASAELPVMREAHTLAARLRAEQHSATQ
ncbi:MAG: putative peptide modification system cyclase [Tahibacter sp.]